MSRKPMFLASRDRGNVEVDLDDYPEGGAVVDLDDKDPNNYEIIVEDDTPEDDRGRPTQVDDPIEVTEEELRGYGHKAQERIKRLTFERETFRRQADEASRNSNTAVDHAQRLTDENERLRTSVTMASTSLASTMLKEREASMASARTALANAHNEGDGAAIADATAKVSELAAEITIIRANQPKPRDPNAPPEPQRQQQQQQQQPAPQTLAPNVVEWLGHNRWFNRPGNEEKTSVAMVLHKRLIDSGVNPNSDAYTKGLDEGMKKVFAEHRSIAETNTPQREREPARRGDIVGSGSRQPADNPNPRRMVLTASELSLAKRLGVSPQAYAASKAKQQSQQQGSAR